MRRALRAGLLLGVVAALAGVWAAPKPGGHSPSTATAARSDIPHVDVPPLGANFFLEREVEDWKRERTVAMAREAGIRWGRQMFTWEEIEPRKGEFYDEKFHKVTWEKYDAIVDLAERYGIRLIVRLERPPAWTRRDNTYPGAPPDRMEDYFTFVRTVASRYAGRIQHYQIWTEPNIWPEWGAQGVDPEGYVELLRGAYQAVKSTDPDALVLSAPLAPTLEESSRNLSEIKYLERMYQAGAAPYFDILSANAYGFDAPPDAPPDPGALNFSRLLLLRKVMERYGDTAKAVWFNEFGWNAAPGEFPPDKLTWRRVSETDQARYTARAITMAREWGWVGVLNYWYFRHVGDIPVTQADYFFRMVDVDFTPRPVYHEVKQLGRDMNIAPTGAHGELHPSVETAGRWQQASMAGASGGRVLRSAGSGGSLTITFHGTGLALRASAPGVPVELGVLIDGRETGTPVELRPEHGANWLTVPVVSGLSPGPHAVRLEEATGTPAGAWALDGFVVEDAPSPLPFWAAAAVLVAALAGLAASFRWRQRA